MKVNEVIGNTKQVQLVKPQAVAQQERVAQVVKQRVAGDAQQQQPTEMDKVLGIMQHAELKKQADMNYAQQLRQQLAGAEAQLGGKQSNVSPKRHRCAQCV